MWLLIVTSVVAADASAVEERGSTDGGWLLIRLVWLLLLLLSLLSLSPLLLVWSVLLLLQLRRRWYWCDCWLFSASSSVLMRVLLRREQMETAVDCWLGWCDLLLLFCCRRCCCWCDCSPHRRFPRHCNWREFLLLLSLSSRLVWLLMSSSSYQKSSWTSGRGRMRTTKRDKQRKKERIKKQFPLRLIVVSFVVFAVLVVLLVVCRCSSCCSPCCSRSGSSSSSTSSCCCFCCSWCCCSWCCCSCCSSPQNSCRKKNRVSSVERVSLLLLFLILLLLLLLLFSKSLSKSNGV